MALTKTPIELSSTPSIVDGGNATAITIDSSENSTFAGTVNGLTLASGGVTGPNSSNFTLNTANSVRINIDSNDSATGESFIVGHNQTAINQSNVLFKVQEDGKVSVGTENPAGKFHVAGHTGSVTSIFESSGNGDTVPVQLKVKANNGTTSTQGLYGNAGSASTDNTITLGTSGTSGLIVDSSGRITSPTQPAFLVRPSSTQSNIAANAAQTQIVFGTEIFDQGSNFASNIFTAPVTGRYQFNLTLYLTGFDVSASYYAMYITTSNNNYELINSGSVSGASDPAYRGFGWSCLADMDANDTAQIHITQSGGAAQTDVTIYSRFSGFLAC